MERRIETEATLLDVLHQMFAESSTATLRKMLTQGRVLVNQEVVYRAKHDLVSGDIVAITDRQRAAQQSPPPQRRPSIDLDIVFEDESILAVNKPSHLLSVATDRLEVDTLHNRCVEHLKLNNDKAWCYIVHRLDKDTSGIMVFAKTKDAKEYLQEQFSDRSVHRTYLALVEGQPKPPVGVVHAWLYEDKHLNVKAVNKGHPQGKEAISHYRIVSTDEAQNTSLVEVMIETGRRHQIRMAMQYLGTPVVGDIKHGAQTNPYKRIMLHASALEFLHPETDDPVRFEAQSSSHFRITS